MNGVECPRAGCDLARNPGKEVCYKCAKDWFNNYSDKITLTEYAQNAEWIVEEPKLMCRREGCTLPARPDVTRKSGNPPTRRACASCFSEFRKSGFTNWPDFEEGTPYNPSALPKKPGTYDWFD